MPNQFGDYTSFLEMAFAINLLFGVWDGLSGLLLDKRRKNFALYMSRFHASALDNDGAAVLGAIQRRDTKCTVLCDGIKKWGRILGIVAAIIISILMFVMGNGRTVEIWPEILAFGILALPVPLACLAMFSIHIIFRFWTQISFADIVKNPDDDREAERILGSFGQDDDRAGWSG